MTYLIEPEQDIEVEMNACVKAVYNCCPSTIAAHFSAVKSKLKTPRDTLYSLNLTKET